MTLQEFVPGMERLRTVYGEKLYPEERIKAFFDELRGIDPKLWASVVDRLVKEESRPPMMKEIRMAIAAEKERHREVEKIQIRNESDRFFKTVPLSKEIRERFPHLFKKVAD